jgi:hypothetical protein
VPLAAVPIGQESSRRAVRARAESVHAEMQR